MARLHICGAFACALIFVLVAGAPDSAFAQGIPEHILREVDRGLSPDRVQRIDIDRALRWYTQTSST
jgi:hypothetical protein